MKKVLVKVKNVLGFYNAVHAALDPKDGIEGSISVSGDKGAGKTRTAISLCARTGNILYVRANPYMTACWLLRTIIKESGLATIGRSTESLYDEAIIALRQLSGAVIIDEMEDIANSFKLLELIKALIDETSTVFVFLGGSGFDRILRRHGSLYDRVGQRLDFKPLDKEDISIIAKESLEIETEESGLEAFSELIEPRFRPVLISLRKLERWARATKIGPINEDHVRGFFAEKFRIPKTFKERPQIKASAS